MTNKVRVRLTATTPKIAMILVMVLFIAASPLISLQRSKNRSPGSSMCSHSASNTIRVACVGDSLTRGDASHEDNKNISKKPAFAGRGNYPKMLQSMLGPRFDVRNFGKGGATACNATGPSAYIETPHYAAALAFDPHVAVIMLGTNDAKVDNWEGSHCGGRSAYRAGMEQIISGIIAKASSSDKSAPTIVLVPPPPIVQEGKFGISGKFLPDIREEIRARGSAAVATCDVGIMVTADLPIQLDSGMFKNDGIHLNTNGTSRLACVVFDELIKQCHDGWKECMGVQQIEWSRAEWQCRNLLIPISA